MPLFRKYLVWLIAIMVIAGCRQKKKPSLSGEEPVEVSDFIDFFSPLALPYQAGDTIFQKKDKDSLLISYKVITQFVPDSVISKVYGKNVKPKIYPIGKTNVSDEKIFLLIKTYNATKKALFVLGFDKKNNFIAGMPVLQPDQLTSTTQSVTVDKRLAITKTVMRKNPDGTTSEGKDVYDLSMTDKKFSLAMTDPLEDKTELINPIDTLPRKSKYAADYSNGKLNLVSIRDGRKGDRVSFFIHFEKNNGECTGELKGEAMFRTANTAEYRKGGDPCVLKFIFSSSSVTLKEVEGCGSRRGLNCSFDGSFARKRNPKPPATSKTAKKKS